MKRLITCAALLLFVGSVVLGQVRERRILEDNGFSRVESITEENGRTFTTRVDYKPADPRRRELMEQLRLKVDFMTDAEVEKALETTLAELQQNEAGRELTEAIKALRAIEKDYKGSPYANSATRMLNALVDPASAPREPTDVPAQ